MLQNAMNAAEVTDKLGLHSLRQRAWVSFTWCLTQQNSNDIRSSFNPLVPPLVTVFMKVSNGLPLLSRKPVTPKFLKLSPPVRPE